MKLTFIENFNDGQPKGVDLVGVPHGTRTWYLGESIEKNGSWKHAPAKAKSELIKVKCRLGMDTIIIPTDIIFHILWPWFEGYFKMTIIAANPFQFVD